MTALLVATNGGHLSQLIALEPRMTSLSSERIWITFDSPQARSLLKGRNRFFIEPINERDVLGVLRGARLAHRLMSTIDVSSVVSTGSAIALSFLPYAVLRRIPAHYVESAARVDRPSLTGRVLAGVPGVNLFRQYPKAARGRWRYGGSVFEGFKPSTGAARSVRKVVVTLGTGDHGFRRLVDRLVKIIPQGVDVLWQTGATDVSGLGIVARPLIPAAELDRAILDADAVVAHAGCGSALSALNSGKYPVLVARQPEHGELVDHHQVELARWLGERDLAIDRTPQDLTFDDVVRAAARAVGRRSDPPSFRFA